MAPNSIIERTIRIRIYDIFVSFADVVLTASPEGEDAEGSVVLEVPLSGSIFGITSLSSRRVSSSPDWCTETGAISTKNENKSCKKIILKIRQKKSKAHC